MHIIQLTLTEESRQHLLKKIPKRYAHTFATHMTLIFNPNIDVLKAHQDFAGLMFKILANQEGYDGRAQAVKVTFWPVKISDFKFNCWNKNAHITISMEENVPLVWPNIMLDNPVNIFEISQVDLEATLEIKPIMPTNENPWNYFNSFTSIGRK
jgi:hypothetical protein